MAVDPRPRCRSLAPRVLVAAALVGSILGLGCDDAPAAGEAPKAPAPPPAKVEVATVRAGALDDRRSFLGEVRAFLRAEIGAGAAGEVQEVRFREGDRVARGELLAVIDTSLASARLHALQASRRRGSAQLEQAKRDAERAQSLGAGIVAAAEIERERTAEEALRAEVSGLDAQAKQARAELARHRLDAPFDGVVAARSVDPGDWVSAGQRVLDLVATDRAEVLVGVPPTILGYIAEGDAATIEGPAGAAIEATIVGVVRALDPRTRTARVRLEPREGAPWLLPGAPVDVAFRIRREGEGLLVPRDALVSGVTETRVICARGGVATPVVVEVVATAGALALVRGEGLEAGEQVVVRGNERLRPGQPVEVIGVAEAPASADQDAEPGPPSEAR